MAKTLEELGLSNFLPAATARHQDMVAEMKIAETFDGKVPHDRAVLARAMRFGQSVDFKPGRV